MIKFRKKKKTLLNKKMTVPKKESLATKIAIILSLMNCQRFRIIKKKYLPINLYILTQFQFNIVNHFFANF